LGVLTLNKLLNGKKGQFYILIALILISYAFTLARQDVPVRKQKDSFQLLHEGYMAEAPIVVNNAVYDEANATARLANFTNVYMEFARSSEPGFRMAYLFSHDGALTTGNRLEEPLNVTLGSSSYIINPDAELTLGAANETLQLGGLSYLFQFSQERLQLKAVFRAADKLTKRVFVYG